MGHKHVGPSGFDGVVGQYFCFAQAPGTYRQNGDSSPLLRRRAEAFPMLTQLQTRQGVDQSRRRVARTTFFHGCEGA